MPSRLRIIFAFLGAAVLLGSGLSACGTTLKTQQVSTTEMAAEVAKQREIALLDQVELSRYMHTIAFDLLSNNVPLCGARVHHIPGMAFWTLENYEKQWRKPAKQAFGLTQGIHIRRVADNGPAAQAGLQIGDSLIKVGSHEVAPGKDGLAALQSYLEKNLTDAPLGVVYAREDTVKTTSLTPTQACDYQVVYSDKSDVNAFADGRRVVMLRGIIEFVRNDDELAMIIGHELAHNILDHISKKQTQMAGGMLGGLLLDVLAGTSGQFSRLGGQLGAQAFSPAYESEADYMGLYATARAGYNINKAPYLWRRMGARNTGSIALTSTHPPTAERFVALEKTVAEIQQKQTQALPLVPDRKNPEPQ